MPSAIVTVTNDLTTDQRVDRTCRTLVKAGYDVLLVGRRLGNSKPLAPRSYRMHRMQLLLDRGAKFYAEFNVRLFVFLLFHRFDLVFSNDLDTLPACRLAVLLKHPFSRRPQIHDCHEYFRGVPELVGRKTVTCVWKWLEDRIFPSLRFVVAVNRSVAGLYTAEYGNPITVVRNVPLSKSAEGAADKGYIGIRPEQRMILYQGAVNVDRGLEEAVMAMKFLKTDAVLVIAGIGDIYERLKLLAGEQGVSGRVRFLGQVPFGDLHAVTLAADLGLSIEKDVSINYHFCLPNKFLDYVQARVPVLVSPLPEMKALVEQYGIGGFIDSHDPKALAARMDTMLQDAVQTQKWKKNLEVAAGELCWENEEEKLLEVIIETRVVHRRTRG